ncbi:MAG: ATP-binding protein, partial [Bacteroidia bacterium]
ALQAHKYATEALMLARNYRNLGAEKHALTLIGEYYYNINDVTTARKYFRQSQNIQAKDTENFEGYNYVLWGNTFRISMKTDSAIFYLEKAIPLLEIGKNPHFLRYAYLSAASLLMDNYDLEKVDELLEKALQLAKEQQNSTDLANVWAEKGRLESLKDNYLQAKKYLNEATKLIPPTGFSYTRLIKSYYLGEVEYSLGNFNLAVSNLINCLEMKEIENNEDIKAQVFSLLGEIYIERGNYELSLKYFLEGINIMERLGMKKDLSNTLSSLAWLYFKQYNDAETEAFAKKALAIADSLNDDYSSSHAHSVLGSLYSAQNKYEKGLEQHELALKLRKKIQSRYGISQSIYNMATVYERMGNLDQAISFASQTLKLDKELGNLYNYGLSHKKLAALYLKKGGYELAKQHLNTADSCAKFANSLELRRDVDLLTADWLEKKGDLKGANEYLRQAFKINDSLFNVASLQKTAEIRGVFDLENIEIKSKQREQKIELQQEAMKNQRQQFILVTIILVLVSLMLLVSFNFHRTTHKKNEALSIEIAEREKAENELSTSKQELERLFKDLEQKNVELETTSKYKSEFLANMSHELRTPLNSILILAKVLQDNRTNNLSPKQIEYANVIRKSGTDLLRLINDVLDLAKVESGKMELDFATHEINTLVNNMKMSFTAVAQDKKITFEVKVDASLPKYIYTDLDRLEQIIRNLLSNAFKFTSVQGMVKLQLKKVISTKNQQEMLEIAVTDSGIGIPKEKHQQVFMAFQQGDGSTQRKYGGTGLGLSISKEFAKLLGGDIFLESEEGKGATFTIVFPLSPIETPQILST